MDIYILSFALSINLWQVNMTSADVIPIDEQVRTSIVNQIPIPNNNNPFKFQKNDIDLS